MMKRIFAWALVFILGCISTAACAADDYDTIIGGILTHLSDGQELQEWLSEDLSQNAGGSMDTLIPALLRMNQSLDFSNYAAGLERKLDEGIKSVTTRQRSALMLSVLDDSAAIPKDFPDETIGEMGVMSYVYGIHLLNNGFSSKNWTIDTLADMLACLQLPDGGWAVSGQYGDPDVTAMCLQALSLCDDGSDESRKMIDLALTYLENAQLPDGGFSSYGNPACESSAQVIVALLSLGIDPLSDARFTKNGNTALDAMLSFRLADGSFSHIADNKTNTMACVQALCGLVALQNPDQPFFDFSNVRIDSADSKSLPLPLWKLISFGSIALFMLLGTILSLCKKRARVKRVLTVLVIGAVAAYAVWTINIESTASYYSEVQTDKAAAGQAWISIDCSLVSGRADDGSTPEDGLILPRTQIEFYEGDSVFDVLTYAARKYGIHLEYDGASADLAYLNGINYLYEHAYGDLSGWIYLVNGVKQSIGCGNYQVVDGDEINWHYTLTLGEDIL